MKFEIDLPLKHIQHIRNFCNLSSSNLNGKLSRDPLTPLKRELLTEKVAAYKGLVAQLPKRYDKENDE